MKTEHILKKYDVACLAILNKFLENYFCDAETEIDDIEFDAVGGQRDGIYNIGDYFIGFGDMITCLRLRIPEKTFFAWYDHSLEAAMQDKTFAILENYSLMTKNTL